MKKLFILLVALISVNANAQTLDKTWPVTDYPVHCMYKDEVNNLLYIGGDFNWIGPSTPYAAVLNTTTGKPDLSFPYVSYEVHGAIPDGSGGQYIYGKFSKVGGLPRSGLAHIDAMGNVTAWNPNTTGDVAGLLLVGNTVYVSGSFTAIGGQQRNNLAAVDATTGAVTAWNPNANGAVGPMAVNGTTIFVAGLFSTIGGSTRNKIAEIDLATGNATPFQVSNVLGNAIHDLAVSGGNLYLVGGFSHINNQARSNIAAIDIATSTLTSFNPGSNGEIYDMLLDGSTIYVTGTFSTFGGLPRVGSAAIDLNTSVVTAWNPGGGGYKMAKDGSTIYLANGVQVEVVDDVTGQPLGLPVNANGLITCLVPGVKGLFIGGYFMSAGAKRANKAAAIDCATGEVLDWTPAKPNGIVSAIARSGNTVYLGGDFTKLGTDLRKSIGAVDATTGAVTAFAPEPAHSTLSPIIKSIVAHNGLIYAGGLFTSIGGQQRTGIAALDPATGSANSWDAGLDNTVNVIKFHNNNMYVGGNFNFANSQPRINLAAFDAAGALTGWNPAPGSSPIGNANDIAIQGNAVYVAGKYTTIGGAQRNSIAALDINTGAVLPSFNAGLQPSEFVTSLAVVGSQLYMAGTFELPGSVPLVKNFGMVDATTGSSINWAPGIGTIGTIYTMATDTGRLYVGGVFHVVDGEFRYHMAAFKLPPGLGIENTAAVNNTHPLTIHPNPITGGQFTCTFSSTKTETIELTITDITGHVLHTQKVNAVNGNNTVNVNVPYLPGNQLLMVNIAGVGVGKVMVK